MAFNTLEYLEAGKVDFVYRLYRNDTESLINSIRNSERKDSIINGFLPLLMKKLPHFCFSVIYDNPKFINEAWYTLHKSYSFNSLPKELFIRILKDTAYGLKYLKKYYNQAIIKYYNDLDFILEYMFNNYESFKTRLRELSLTKDMHLRFMFMKYIIINKPDLVRYYYKDFTKYLVDYNYKKYEQLTLLPEYMNAHDISL